MKTGQHVSIGRKRKQKAGRITSIGWLVLAMILFVSQAFATGAHQPAVQEAAPPGHLTITVGGSGLTATSSTVAAGIVHLSVENQSGRENVRLRVTREGGAVVRELAAPEGAKDWKTELELEAGQYVISEVGSSSGSYRLTAQGPPAGQ
jgi:hypothetical protein